MMHKNLDMTPEALAKRADEVKRMDCVADYLGGDDLRTVTLFLAHEGHTRLGDDDYADQFTLESKEVIGVTLSDDDDDSAPVEVMTRDEAYDRFGYKVVAGWEEV